MNCNLNQRAIGHCARAASDECHFNNDLILCSEHSLSALVALESNMLRVSGQVGTDGCSVSGVLYASFFEFGDVICSRFFESGCLTGCYSVFENEVCTILNVTCSVKSRIFSFLVTAEQKVVNVGKTAGFKKSYSMMARANAKVLGRIIGCRMV